MSTFEDSWIPPMMEDRPDMVAIKLFFDRELCKVGGTDDHGSTPVM
jgi:hypothetical protein